MIRKVVEKWENMPAAAQSSIAFIVSSFIVKGISFIVTPIFTRLLDPSEYGLISLYNSWVSILEVVALLGLTSAGVFNVGMNDYRNSRDSYISSILFMCNILTFALFALIFSYKYIFNRNFLLPNNLIVLMMIRFVFDTALIFWLNRQRYEFRYKMALLVTVTSTIISQIFAMFCVLYVNIATPGIVKLWATQCAMLMFEIPLYILLMYRGKSFFNINLWREVTTFALPLLPHYLAQHIMSSSDKIMIAEMYSRNAAGIYSVVVCISIVATMIWTSINGSLVPYTFEKLNEGKSSEISKTVIRILLGYAAICVGISLFAPETLKILAPPKYYCGIYAVPPIVGVAFMSALYNIYANIEFYHKKSLFIAIATIVSTVINLILNYFLIPIFGFVAAAYTTLISYCVLVVMHYFGYRHCVKQRFVYSDSKILCMTVAVLIVCLISQLLYSLFILRYLLILVTMIFALRAYLLHHNMKDKEKIGG